MELLNVLVYLCFYFTMINANLTNICPNTKTPISFIRKRRYLSFPDNSAASITISSAKTFLTHIPSGWFMTTDLDVIYPLPDHKFVAAHSRRKLHHRQKKDLWDRLRSTIDFNNMNGHACLLKSICEAKTHLAPRGKSLVHDMLRAIFTTPSLEEEFREEIKDSYLELLDPNFCDTFYECPISILQHLLMFNAPKHKKQYP